MEMKHVTIKLWSRHLSGMFRYVIENLLGISANSIPKGQALIRLIWARVGFSRGRLEESSQEALNSQAKFWAKITHFCRDFEIWPKILHFCRDFISEWWIIAEISCVWKKFWVRNFVPQEEIYCLRKKFPVTGRNVLSQEEISSDRTKFQLKERNSLSHKEIPVAGWSSLSLDKFPETGRNFLSKEDISSHRKKFPVTGRKLLSQEEFSSQRAKFQATGRNS